MPSGTLKIDLGCGPRKKVDHCGVDIEKHDCVDRVCDFNKDKLPFHDSEVTHVYSSHCFEHIKNLRKLVNEIVRVRVDGAELEIWVPYVKFEQALCPGHAFTISETTFQDICNNQDGVWFPSGNPWRLERFDYHFTADGKQAIEQLQRIGLDETFARKHLWNIYHQMGFFGKVKK